MPLSESKSASDQSLSYKVLFGDPAPTRFQPVMDELVLNDIITECVSLPKDLYRRVQEVSYSVVVVNLLIGESGPFELVNKLRKASRNPQLEIIVISKQRQRINVYNAINAGATDFMGEPFSNEAIITKILYHLRPKKVMDTDGFEKNPLGKESTDFINLLLESSEKLSKTASAIAGEAMFEITQKLAKLLGSNRTSLIIAGQGIDSGLVVVSSDDASFRDHPIDLNKYPEVQHVMNIGSFVLIEDISKNLLTRRIQENVKSISIASLMVFPIRYQGEVTGVLTIRRSEVSVLPPFDVLRCIQAIAMTLSIHARTKMILRKIYKDFPKKTA